MRKRYAIIAMGLLAAAPAHASILRIDFGGQLANAFPGGPAYPNGTGFGGSLTVDTATAATTQTVNSVGTFARFNGAGTFGLGIGADSFDGTVDVLTNDLANGADSVRFFLNLRSGYTFTLAYASLPGSAITGATIPDDPAILSRLATGSISNAQMRGNFGAANASASLIPAVPEPTVWGMLIGGFALVGLALRRRTGRLLPRPALA